MVLDFCQLNPLLRHWIEELADQVFGLSLHIRRVVDLHVEDSRLKLLLAFGFKGWSASKHLEEKNA